MHGDTVMAIESDGILGTKLLLHWILLLLTSNTNQNNICSLDKQGLGFFFFLRNPGLKYCGWKLQAINGHKWTNPGTPYHCIPWHSGKYKVWCGSYRAEW